MNWNDIPSLSALRAFEALARHGTMTRAAQSLNVTHAAIAQHVRALETRLELQLTQRSGRGIILTPEGKQLAETLTNGFGVIHDGIRDLATSSADRPLSVTVTPSFAENWLMPRLGQFWSDHPDIMLSITPSVAVSDLRRDGYDLGIRYGGGNWPGVKSTFLASADYVVVAAASLLNGKTACSTADLEGFPWLFETLYQEPQRWAFENGLEVADRQIRKFETLSMTLSALRAGVGVSVVSRALIAKDLSDGTLVAVSEIPRKGMAYYIVTQPDILSAHAKTFKAWLLKSA